MNQIHGVEGRGETVAPISRFEQIQEDFLLWSIEFSGRYRRMRGEEFPDDLISLGKGSSTISEEVVSRWLNGHSGEGRWNFLQPVHTATSLLDKIDQLDPYSMEYIERLVGALELPRRERVVEGVILANAFTEHKSDLPTAIRLGNGNCIVLGKRHLLSVSESSRTEYAELGYFWGATTNRRGLRRSAELDRYALVRAQRMEVNFITLFLPVLCRSSYETGRDSTSNRFLQIFTRPVIRI